MNARSNAITQTLSSNPCAAGMLAVMSHEGKVDGIGYKVEHVQPGRGFSAVEYSVKELPNGRQVTCRTDYPGLFDGLVGLPTDITAIYSVWVGWEEYNPDYERLYDSPPLPLPVGATEWSETAFDGPRHWYADFTDPELAEAFAESLPFVRQDEVVLPLCRAANSIQSLEKKDSGNG